MYDPGDPTTPSFVSGAVRARFSPVGPGRRVMSRTDGPSRILDAVITGPSGPVQRAFRRAQLPFTLSHAAAVLPAVRGDGSGRGRLVPAVLVAGSFSPDMTYYVANVLPGAMEFGTVTHSFPGVF